MSGSHDHPIAVDGKIMTEFEREGGNLWIVSGLELGQRLLNVARARQSTLLLLLLLSLGDDIVEEGGLGRYARRAKTPAGSMCAELSNWR